MSLFPHSRLFVGPVHSIVITGPHIQVVDTQNSALLHATTRLEGNERDAVLKSGPIRAAAVGGDFKHVVTVGDDKKLKVWQVPGLRLLSERELPKKPTDIHFTRDSKTIVVSDKFGDVFSYSLRPATSETSAPTSEEPEQGSSKRNAVISHENPSGGELILGHVSLLTCFALSHDEQYIITADRDEHIRVSWYPKGFVIENYCLGHEKYISAVHIPAFAPSVLVSGGGDPMLKVWDWHSGTLLSQIPIRSAVERYIAVRTRKHRGWDDGDGEEGGNYGEAKRWRKKRGRKARGKRREEEEVKAKSEAEGRLEEDAPEAGTGQPAADEDAMDVREGDEDIIEQEETAQAEGVAAEERNDGSIPPDAPAKTEEDQRVLVIHKIASLDLGEHGRVLVFSAVGVTALFHCAFPTISASLATPEPLTVHALDLGQPIVDFTTGPEGTTWVLLGPHPRPGGKGTDTAKIECTNASSAATVRQQGASSERPRLAAVVSWASGQPVEISGAGAPALLAALEGSCAVDATPTDLKILDVFSALSALPKNVDPEHDPLRRDLLAEADAAASAEGTPDPGANASGQGRGQKGKGKNQKEGLTQREMARLKKKRALVETLQKREEMKGTPEGGEKERESKKIRVDSADASANVVDSANAMDES